MKEGKRSEVDARMGERVLMLVRMFGTRCGCVVWWFYEIGRQGVEDMIY